MNFSQNCIVKFVLLPVDFESLDDKALDELLSEVYCEVRSDSGSLIKCFLTICLMCNQCFFHLSVVI